ncbi:hypothetical protein Aple_086500 [Acrocarpospora pleiomorpha]|uniref:Uncharacterized protein n=1 Tax=Acrocarpospora pleiomorpha TaxID=90975 RepID=A0A5M3Y1V3_9ACTN|nr:hypothetical protein [Acrocarpospora pleiomorpha]GES25751.1 hypothetical protein Aple_086500 [Acrocarpospora pleiomorpha]
MRPMDQGNLAHLLVIGRYLAQWCWKRPVVANNRVFYKGRSRRVSDLVDEYEGKRPAEDAIPGLSFDLGFLPADCHEHIASLDGMRMPRRSGFTRTRFDILDLGTLRRITATRLLMSWQRITFRCFAPKAGLMWIRSTESYPSMVRSAMMRCSSHIAA